MTVTGREGNVIFIGSRSGVVTLERGGHRASVDVSPRDRAEDISERLVLAMQRTIALFDMADPEWIDLGGES